MKEIHVSINQQIVKIVNSDLHMVSEWPTTWTVTIHAIKYKENIVRAHRLRGSWLVPGSGLESDLVSFENLFHSRAKINMFKSIENKHLTTLVSLSNQGDPSGLILKTFVPYMVLII